ncbi:MAG TPA: hypothetical protein VJA26_13240 [Gammaproteobacteria bacterium]|nr:hypothetical protein [Gammaproteobacteria bacterium]
MQVEKHDVETILVQGSDGVADPIGPRYVDWPAVVSEQALPQKFGVVRVVLD